jgi:RNA polymerase sigma factor (sigma-70 family)
VGVTTTNAPDESQHLRGRLGDGAAAARTEDLYGRYGRTVSGLCRALLRDRAEAEDAAQQAFLSAHRALLNGSDPREPAAWLATIARNECWARIRTRMREPLPTDELQTASLHADPLAEAIRRADLAALWAAIEALPRQQRDALLLREFGGLSYEELSEALAVSGPAVESLLFRARTRLRVQLRAAYASFTGASWIESLVGLFAGGSAPVAAKVAALGVGAAAVGSSAVVVPHVLDSHAQVGPAPQRPAAVHPNRHDAARPPVFTERLVSAPAKTSTHNAIAGSDEAERSNSRDDGQEVDQRATSEPSPHQRGSAPDGGGDEDRLGSSGPSGPSGGDDGLHDGNSGADD